MKVIVLLNLTFLLFFNSLRAQPGTFLKMYNRGNVGYAVREQNGNSYMVAGGTNFYYNYHWMMMSPPATTNIHFFKTTSLGNLLWEKIFSFENYRSIATWMEPTSDGGAVITGHSNSDFVWPPDSNDVILIKTDNTGAVSWAKSYDSGTDDLGFCVQQTFDGGFILSGFQDAAPVSLMGTTNALLIKTDLNGIVIWERKYQLPVRDFDTGEAFPVVVRQTADSGYVLVGTTSASHQADVCVIRTNATGDLMWAKSYQHDNSMFRLSVGLDIVESASGNFIIAGSMDKDRSLSQYNYPYILSISNTGAFINAKILSSVPDQMFQSGFSSVEHTADGGFFFTGMGGYGGFGDQAQLLKTNDTLDMQWSRVYSWDGLATMGSRSGRSTSDGCYIFTGKRQFSGTVLMKTNNQGMIPCKNPFVLVEIHPSVIVQNHVPVITNGVNSVVRIINTQIALIDTSSLCPVIISSLPVNLISFSAKVITDQQVKLLWSTAAEINNDHFVIEKSIDGIDFKNAGFVKGAGNSTSLLNYSFIDKMENGIEVVYYRLKQVDFNGNSEFSRIVALKSGSHSNFTVNAFPDYETHSIKIAFNRGSDLMIHFALTDVLGRIIISGVQPAGEQPSQVIIETGNLPRGIYYYSVRNGNQIENGRIFY